MFEIECPQCRGQMHWKHLHRPTCPQCEPHLIPAGFKAESVADFCQWAEQDLKQDGLFINFDELLKRYRQQLK